MAEETIEQMNRLLDGSPPSLQRAQAEQMMANRDREKSFGSVSDMEMQGMAPPMRPEGMGAVSQAEIDMITSAQEGLMQMDPEGTKDIVQGMETTKARVAKGAGLTEPEFMGIKEILEKIGGAFKGMMGGGDTMTYMVDGNPVEMTERERMSAINSGMLVQDMGTYQVDDRMEQMTPDTYADRVASGEITPDELMMESSGSTMTEAEKAIRDNAEFNRRAQEEQERMFNMNNPPVMSGERPRLRSTQQEANMAEVNVENMEENAELFMEKMGFAHDTDGLDMTDDQLVNFLLLCHHMQYGVGDEYEEEEMMEEEMHHDGSDVKVKIMKVGSGDDVHAMMNKILGG